MNSLIPAPSARRDGADELPDWREQALNEALKAASEDGLSKDALLLAVRRHRPELATTLLYADLPRLEQFLHAECARIRSLAPGSSKYADSTATGTYLGWYAAVWEGETYEVAYAPEWGEPGYALCIGTDSESLDRFVERAMDFSERPAGRCLRYAQGWSGDAEMDAEIGRVTWHDIVLAPSLMAEIREAVEGFCVHRSSFEALGFPWRRGILLVGPPGNGKTMISKAAAAALPDLPLLYVRDLKERNCTDSIRSIFDRARRLSPCLLAFEDLDGFIGDSNRTVFLNELDGFKNNEGLLIIASSNHPGKIDEALIKRPSRFDRVFHIGLPAYEERREYCRRFLARWSLKDKFAPSFDIDRVASDIAERSDRFTPAFLKEAFLSAALKCAQCSLDTLDERFAVEAVNQTESLKRYLQKSKDRDALAEFGGDKPIGLRR